MIKSNNCTYEKIQYCKEWAVRGQGELWNQAYQDILKGKNIDCFLIPSICKYK